MNVVIIDYNAGNTQSVIYALNRLGVEPVLSADQEVIQAADKVIFPGVGEASTAMSFLKERKLDEVIKSLKQPVFGVCLGLQLLCKHSEENDTDCLGIFDINVKKFEPKLKVPQMGWNNLEAMNSPLFNGLNEAPYVYYVHSYYAELSDYTIAETNYVNRFSAALNKDNFFALQAHPEKSGKIGERILQNFLSL
ncbi:imidazole glycerol phosphate synthase subunit HisH [Roseivirga pacifica]|uniref:imidazole glycerol phosphate synthase subunit HisH n=1 Tax=Roseivirga pacifica TaxID=1267423 RepID=UPI002095D522|nr:imidazole glycerol phosphate synthase subunit HisH [Roseivirga pacifica]MCO6358083.1 imidazole glycerol phosphate synthase subunit HisH [Roseivirga pacifica]MCO6366521.1 imidazole glycerol phosphate synthase subunit HisH [Roseivirga pacifica]MCO6371006.1 imidazole glycerol phosphate synthase subunit HisH [Roseivirga pacifica]MCO6373814.1 imidazole glycerol phosphate synthase subunit HisH [Roseivirga pacifica]MCO6380795.1 imidazole glycerol phosphate synthase subunit HisH [Roseivirga pacific